jgi:hypothetical protein
MATNRLIQIEITDNRFRVIVGKCKSFVGSLMAEGEIDPSLETDRDICQELASALKGESDCFKIRNELLEAQAYNQDSFIRP